MIAYFYYWLIRQKRKFLARARWDLNLVCEMSKDLGDCDYHDFQDSDNGGYPEHFVKHVCKRCGKLFVI